jgi:hypothetical protein
MAERGAAHVRCAHAGNAMLFCADGFWRLTHDDCRLAAGGGSRNREDVQAAAAATAKTHGRYMLQLPKGRAGAAATRDGMRAYQR